MNDNWMVIVTPIGNLLFVAKRDKICEVHFSSQEWTVGGRSGAILHIQV